MKGAHIITAGAFHFFSLLLFLSLQILITGNILLVQSLSAWKMIQIAKTVHHNGSYCRCVLLVLRNALVVKVAVCMPDLAILEVVSFRVSKVMVQ